MEKETQVVEGGCLKRGALFLRMFLRLHTKALSSKMIDGGRRMQDMDYFNFDNEYREQWVSYGSVLHTDLIREQIKCLRGVGIELGTQELKFIYTSDLAALEEKIEEAYQELRIDDWETAVCNEVFFTNKIEGANTTLARTCAVHQGAKIENSSERMVLNGFRATRYLNLLQRSVLSKRELRQLWGIVTDGVCQNEQIAGELWRNGSVRIGAHWGVKPELLDSSMTSLLKFSASSVLKEHQWIKAALIHYAFEFIHPFCDGNGRVGRLLMMNHLIMNGYERLKAVSVTKEIDACRAGYDYAFFQSENEQSDCTPFIQFCLEMFYNAIVNCKG